MKLCKDCKNRGKKYNCRFYDSTSNYAEKCKDFEPQKQTNFDHIHSMTIEELAEFITGLNEHCLAGIGECDCSGEYRCCSEVCGKKVMQWLQSEVKG